MQTPGVTLRTKGTLNDIPKSMGVVLIQHEQKGKCLRGENDGYSTFQRRDLVKHMKIGWTWAFQILERISQKMAVSLWKRMLISRTQHEFAGSKSCPQIIGLSSRDAADQ